MAKGNISGYVVNSQSGEPMDFVNIQLIDARTGKALPIGTSTDLDGHFSLSGVADGSYYVQVSNIGSVTEKRPVTVSGSNVDVGSIPLSDDAKVLDEVVVEGVQSRMRFELDRKVFQVDADIASAGMSASEVLESIPSVEVDQEGAVSLRGSESVTVWINGKESGLTADNRAQILEQIPGETIERIEVITNPSAKYSPEGTAGIINIILKKDARTGYFGSAEISGNTRGGGNAGFNFNFNTARWDTYASVGFRMRHNNGGSTSRRYYTDGTFLNSDGERRNHGNNLFVRAGATFHATDKDDIYFNGFGMFGHRWGHTSTVYSSNLPAHWSSNLMYQSTNGDMRGAHGELGYKHVWSDTHFIDIMAAYNYWGGPSSTFYHEQSVFPDDPVDETYQIQDQTINSHGLEVKADYSQMLADWLKFEAGFNGTYSHENTPVTTYEGMSADVMTIDPALYNRFIYNNNISALYFTLGGRVNAFSYSAGLRGEAWQVRTRSLGYGQEESDVAWYRKNFFALFPSAFLSYSLPHDNELQINYTRRIRRPWGGELNSFINISDPTNISYGNPELEPSYSNSFELNYIKSWTMHMISVSAYFRTSDNVYNRISALDGNVMYTTPMNVCSEANSGVEIVGKNSFWRGKIDLTTTVNLYNNHISAWSALFHTPSGNELTVSGKSRDSFAWDARMMFSVKLPWQLSFQATGRYASVQYSAQGTRQPGWSVDCGLRKSVGDWSFSLSVRDLFDSRKFKNTVEEFNYTQDTSRWRGGRQIQLTVKWSFGNMKRKRNDAGADYSEPTSGSGYEESVEF